MVDGASSVSNKKQSGASSAKFFHDQNQSKIVVRHLPPTYTSEQFLDIVSPLPDHDYYRFCKSDLSLGQQHSFCRVYLNIPNRQDLIAFTEKFKGYVFLDKNGNEYICTIEYAPNQLKPRLDQQLRKDPKINSIEQDPDYQSFVANMNAPISGADALPNPEVMLEEIEKKQRDMHDTKNKSGVTSTPLLDYVKKKREEKKQEKISRAQMSQQRRSNKQQSKNPSSHVFDDSRPSSGRNYHDDEYYGTCRYNAGGGGDRSNRHQQRGYEKADHRSSNKEHKRSNATDQSESKLAKPSNSKHKQHGSQGDSQSSKDVKLPSNSKEHTDGDLLGPAQTGTHSKTGQVSAETKPSKYEKSQSDDQPSSSAKSATNSQKGVKNRPSIQIYNPGERVRLRREQNPPS